MDLSIDEYNIDELVRIVKLDNKMPLTKIKIAKHIGQLIKQEKRGNVKKLYKMIGAHLIRHYDDSDRNKKKLDAIDDLDGIDDTKLYMDTQGELIIEKTPTIKKEYNDHIVTGDKNPNFINYIHENVFISSNMRKRKPSSVMCNKVINQKEIYSSTDFIMDLETTKKDVLSVYVTDVSIPRTWYTFDSEYGTTSFMLDDTIYKIDNGNYTPQQLVTQLNLLNDLTHMESIYTTVNEDRRKGVSGIKLTALTFSYNENTKKITITNTLDENREIKWYFKTSTCGLNKKGSKINYNLGILLGFTDISYTILPSNTPDANIVDPVTMFITKKKQYIIEGENVINTIGSTHFFISIDEFSNNKPNPAITSSKIYSDNYKLPDYYNPQTMEISFNTLNIEEIASARENNKLYDDSNLCHPLPENKNNPIHLTKNRKFTILRLKEEMDRIKYNNDELNLIQNINIPDVMATIPVTKDEMPIINWSFNEENNKKRVYFGPIRLSKMRIRLFNDKGYLVHLNGADWAFKMVVKRLYQL